jgi:hypothetical protein
VIAKVEPTTSLDYNLKKMAGERLNLMPDEPDYNDPLFLPTFEILNKALQPDSGFSVEDAVSQLTALFSEGKPDSIEMGDFIGTCLEMAEAIPYTHPSMLKLVSILDLCLRSEQLPEKVESGVCLHHGMHATI